MGKNKYSGSFAIPAKELQNRQGRLLGMELVAIDKSITRKVGRSGITNIILPKRKLSKENRDIEREFWLNAAKDNPVNAEIDPLQKIQELAENDIQEELADNLNEDLLANNDALNDPLNPDDPNNPNNQQVNQNPQDPNNQQANPQDPKCSGPNAATVSRGFSGNSISFGGNAENAYTGKIDTGNPCGYEKSCIRSFLYRKLLVSGCAHGCRTCLP